MIDVDVLSTAAGLREFDAATVAAYCRADENDVVLVLTEHQDLFVKKTPRHGHEPAVPRWRVANVEGLRQRISHSHPISGTARRKATSQPRTEEVDNAAEPRMMLAEHSLLACAQESETAHRHQLASRAMNYLSQCITMIQGEPGANKSESVSDVAALPPRLRFNLALAALTLSETSGQSISRNLLISAYDDATRYAETNLPEREANLLGRFRELARSQSAEHFLGRNGVPTHRANSDSD
jgi:hypothetical protein